MVSSWASEAGLRVYDMESGGTMRTEFQHKSSVLSCAWGSELQNKMYTGSVDGTVRCIDLSEENEIPRQMESSHEAGVKCLEYNQQHSCLVSGSWDKTINIYDDRAAATKGNGIVKKHTLKDKVYAMDTLGDKLVVGTAGFHVYIYDLRNLSTFEQQRESPFKYQTRCISMFPDVSGFALGCIEGRVAMEYMDPTCDKKYAFKSHRKTINGVDTIFPVNCIAFHPTFGTFVTGGCDGVVNCWDGLNKKRLRAYPNYPTSIASLDFNHDGSLLAIASSYTFEQGQKDTAPDQLFVRFIQPSELRPKPRGS